MIFLTNTFYGLTKSDLTIIINKAITDAVINIGTIAIDDEIKNNFTIKGIHITPGVNYNLKINFKTCTENVGGVKGLNWHYEADKNKSNPGGAIINGVARPKGFKISEIITAPPSDYGFVFNIRELDNTFNMKLNGTTLANEEIQFQSYTTLPPNTIHQNIKFKDYPNWRYGANGIPNIWEINGTDADPAVQIVISKTGRIRMYGRNSKTSKTLYELELFNNNFFNTFLWNTDKENKIEVTQKIDGLTVLKGSGAGKKQIDCNK